MFGIASSSAPLVASPRSSPAHRRPDAGAAAGSPCFNPGDPATALGADGLNLVVYWLVSMALLGGLAAGIVWVWIVLRRHTRKTETDPHRLAGSRPATRSRPQRIRERHCFTARPLRPSWSRQHRRMSATSRCQSAERRSGHRSKTRSC